MMERMGTRWQDTAAPRGDDYDLRWARLAASGKAIHGEADLVDHMLEKTGASRILDAGCGTGRVAVELARRGYSVVGVDADPGMLDTARGKDPEIPWINADLGDLETRLDSTFELVLLAGNVMIFLDPGSEGRVLSQLADRLATDGLLVAGFSIRPGRLQLAEYDSLAEAAGLRLHRRWATWDREPFTNGDYAVSVHRRAAAEEASP
jgi:SAM-dependent methyltransferase